MVSTAAAMRAAMERRRSAPQLEAMPQIETPIAATPVAMAAYPLPYISTNGYRQRHGYPCSHGAAFCGNGLGNRWLLSLYFVAVTHCRASTNTLKAASIPSASLPPACAKPG